MATMAVRTSANGLDTPRAGALFLVGAGVLLPVTEAVVDGALDVVTAVTVAVLERVGDEKVVLALIGMEPDEAVPRGIEVVVLLRTVLFAILLFEAKMEDTADEMAEDTEDELDEAEDAIDDEDEGEPPPARAKGPQ